MVSKKIELPLAAQEDVVAVRQAARLLAVEIGLSIVDQTKIVTAASELARNTVVHGGGGQATLEVLKDRDAIADFVCFSTYTNTILSYKKIL